MLNSACIPAGAARPGPRLRAHDRRAAHLLRPWRALARHRRCRRAQGRRRPRLRRRPGRGHRLRHVRRLPARCGSGSPRSTASTSTRSWSPTARCRPTRSSSTTWSGRATTWSSRSRRTTARCSTCSTWAPRCTRCTLDPDGLDVDELRQLLESGVRPKLAHIIPNFQNPAGVTLSLQAPARAARAGRRVRLHHLRGRPVRGHPLPRRVAAVDAEPRRGTGRGGHTPARSPRRSAPVSGSVTWSGRSELIADIAVRATNLYISPSMVAQAIVHQFCVSGDIDGSIATVRRALGERARRAGRVAAPRIPGVSFTEPDGGYFLWVELPTTSTSTSWCRRPPPVVSRWSRAATSCSKAAARAATGVLRRARRTRSTRVCGGWPTRLPTCGQPADQVRWVQVASASQVTVVVNATQFRRRKSWLFRRGKLSDHITAKTSPPPPTGCRVGRPLHPTPRCGRLTRCLFLCQRAFRGRAHGSISNWPQAKGATQMADTEQGTDALDAGDASLTDGAGTKAGSAPARSARSERDECRSSGTDDRRRPHSGERESPRATSAGSSPRRCDR